MKSAKFMTTEVLDQILSQYGADNDLLKEDSLIETTKENIDARCNKYGLLVLTSMLGSLASWYGSSLTT